MSFADKVRNVVRSIPKGEVLTYGEVASIAGSRRAARAVGDIMRRNYDPTVPCHRVVKVDGSIGSYNRGGEDKKRSLLVGEGIIVVAGRWRCRDGGKRRKAGAPHKKANR